MKSVKFLVMVALAGMVMGCSKHSEPVMQEIRIGIGNVQSGSMATKGVADALSATAPSGIVQLSLQGVDVTSRRYQVAAGGSVSVPVGRYSVKGAYKPTALGTAVFNSVYGEPAYSISQEIEVREGVSEYAVQAGYDCFALVIDYSECEKYQWKPWGGTYQDLSWLKRTGDYGVAYFGMESTWSAGESSFTLLAVPAEPETKESAEYILSHRTENGVVKVETGKWYKFGPRDVSFQSGGIGIDYPEWGAGN